jgi:hypothetical protein
VKSDAATYLSKALSQPRSPEQHITFEMLQLKMGIKLSGIFDSEFWDKLVLQATSDEPAVLHAVTAIGSAFRSELLARDSCEAQTCRSMDKEGAQALLEYNLAIRCLKDHLRNTDICSLRVTLITCMLFICFEYLRRNLRTADTHLLNGLRLLRDIHRRHSRDGDLPPLLAQAPDSVDDHLVEAFARLNLQCALFGLGSKSIYIPHRESIPSIRMPVVFESATQARRLLDTFISGTYHLLTRHCSTTSYDDGTVSLFLREQHEIKAGLTSWLSTYERTISQSSPPFSISFSTQLAYMVLRMYHSMAEIIVSASHPLSRETDFDAHNAAFASIIGQAIALAKGAARHLAHRPSSFHSRKSFTVDMGYIPVLYYTALKCREPRLRRHAIKLMEGSPHREGVWDGLYTAAIARRVVALEEGTFFAGNNFDADFDALEQPGLGVGAALPVLPEAARLYQVDVVLPPQGVVNTVLRCVRRRWDIGVGWRMEAKDVSVELGIP